CEMHDMFGNRTALNYPSGRRLTYELDELDRVQTMTENVGATIGRPVAEYAYYGPFRVKTRKSGNGTQLDIEYITLSTKF
ncbi:MAG: RHS repeat protein, partial [Planctomycetes bacterium]|nr:RHS repeat protein [Planctomycetota bacterium]